MRYKNLQKMLKARPFIDEVKWQMNALVDEKILNEDKVVLAAGTSSGKTFFTIMLLNLFYMDKANKKKKTIIIPSAQTNLRSNFEDSIKDFKPDFKYVVCKTCDELRDAVNSNVQVIVCLPQTINLCIDVLPKVEKLIVDEAHVWYYAKTVKNIVKKTQPKQQLLLTGTPSVFILKGGFYMHFVPVMDLYDEGRIADTEVHVVSSYYDFKEKDYNANDNLTLTAKAKHKLADEASFRKVILGMMKKLKNPIKGLKNVNRLTNDVAGRFFKHLDKTIIWANSIKQANKFAEVLRTFNGLENGVLVSHSKNDDGSLEMEKFKSDNDIRVLVSVNRGRMGWSYTELYNAIDFTMTRNLNSILQMMARLFRISKVDPKKRKYFYKVSNSKDAGYYTVIMKGVLLLLDREWYSKFNGRNFNDMRIPVTVPRRTNPNREGCKPKGRPRTTYNYEMIDLPLDMNFFKTVYAKQDDMFSTVAWTTIRKVRTALTGYNSHRVFLTVEEATKIMKRYKTYNEFRKKESQTYEWFNTNKLRKICMDYFNSYRLSREEMIEEAKQATLKWVKKYGKDNTKEFTQKESKNYGRLMRLGYKDWLREQMNFRGHKKIKVYKVTAKGDYGKKIYVNTFKNYKEVIKNTGIKKVYLDLVLSGTYKTAKGYTFEYA